MRDIIYKNTKPCSCIGPGFCDRHKIEKTTEEWIDCLKNKDTRFTLDLKHIYNHNDKTYLSCEDLTNLTISLLPNIVDVKFIIGIPKSGMIPASIIACFLNKELYSFDQKNKILTNIGSGYRQKESLGSIIYLIDDTSHSGNSLLNAKKYIQEKFPNDQIKTVAPITTPLTKNLVDITAKTLTHHYLEWSLFNTHMECAFDMDGIFCRDFTPEEDDDGELYIDTMNKMKMTHIQPRRNDVTIITARLEKYRKQTEDWLISNGFIIKNLFMLDLPNKESRTFEYVINHKAEKYLACKNINFFIESCDVQAKKIFELTKKTVICPLTKSVYSL